MVQWSTSVRLLGGLLGLFLLMPVLMAPTPPSMCTPLKTINDSLSHRRRYMKHNFPVNYTIRIHREEVFKLSNISKMRLQMEELDELVLQRMWFLVNQGVLKKVFQRELPDAIQDIWDCLTEEPDRVPETSWRFASPKSLLDNFCHTMHCLFSECFEATETTDCEYKPRIHVTHSLATTLK
ncbi:interleukin-34 isoform X5 [Dunckerocampus dactyliophorus]|uniref:interleukin-34 isoform X5 n=1 Tax=Dunckerocampus dactyliophorus TaxID=161453 RepID=UPI002406D474|nr:interleukin-34 isoform X5 [Dunckerocampus dactyliophorus]